MYLGVDFRLQDNKTNGHFTPKKQALVEQMSLSLSCDVQDIQEDMKNGIQNTYVMKVVGVAFLGTSIIHHTTTKET